jgi:hypoxanthine phosphoribosyltransferase
MNKQIISWQEYYNHIENLAKLIKPNIHEFNQLLCLARGGLFIGDAFSRIFQLPLAILFTSSYRVSSQRGELYIDNQIAKQNNFFGNQILLLDDLVDSGITMGKVVETLHNNYHPKTLKTATIWKKVHSSYTPNYYLQEIGDVWLEQPFEYLDAKNSNIL